MGAYSFIFNLGIGILLSGENRVQMLQLRENASGLIVFNEISDIPLANIIAQVKLFQFVAISILNY